MAKQTDLEIWIDKINAAFKNKKLTADETEQLRKLARSLATKNGSLGPGDREKLNKEFDRAVQSKGTTPVKGSGSGSGGSGSGGSGSGGSGSGGGKGGGSGNNNGGSNNGRGGGSGDGKGGVDGGDKGGGGGDGGNRGNNNPPPNEREPSDGDTKPTTKPGLGKIDIPKPNNRTKMDVPKDADPIEMPNIDEKIKKEIDKISKNLIDIAREFIEGGIDYAGIDYIPSFEMMDEDGNFIYPTEPYNAPPKSDQELSLERLHEISGIIQNLLDKGVKGKYYNYGEYLDLFELKYDSDGNPYYRLNLELTGAIIEDLDVVIVNNKDDKGN